MKNLKKVLIAGMLALSMSITVHAQSGEGILKSTPTHVPTDTVVNTAVKGQKIQISVANTGVSIQTDLTTISGTPAGVVRLFGSLNGVKYVRVNPTDSLNVNVNALSKVFVVTNPMYSYYEARFAGSGTQSTKMNSKAVWRK